ncbi:MAG: TIR domain-containing protein, partial [Gemmatimonadota bacterium]
MATRDRPAGLGSTDSRSDPYDAFVSYSRRDTDAAERIAVTLRDRGLRVFLDRWCLHAGERWLPEIEDALGQCPAVVIVVGPSGLGDWQQGETELALDRQRRGEPVRVVPVLLPMSEPPLGFLRLNSWIDLREGVGESGLERLARAVAGEVEPAQLRICPYRGLRPFRREDAEFFFGRDEFVDRAIPLLERGGITAVVGASGSGKSSAVHAGVLPRLGRSDPSVRWDVAVMTPGRTPVPGLAASLHDLRGPGVATDEERLRAVRSLGDALRTDELRLEAVADDLLRREGAGDRLLVVVDQWEELYTLCGDPDARALFIESLLRATEDPRVGALLTVRGDFFDDVLEHRGLADRLEGRGLNLGPMNDEELRQCIEEPAHRVGLSFEDGLVDRILEDVRGEPGSLPLLEFVLQQLWQARRGNQLVHDAYRAMGEVRGALATHADARFAALSADQQKSARRIFLQLVQTTAARTATRRRATRAEIGEAGWP